MKAQTITITVTGTKDGVLPEDIAAALQTIPETLRSIDKNMWPVGQPRYQWRVENVTKNSPLNFVLVAALLSADAPQADVGKAFMDGVRLLGETSPKRPKYWTVDDLRRVESLKDVLAHGSTITVASGSESVTVLPEVPINAHRLLTAPVVAAGRAYGCLQGFLRQITVDPRENHLKNMFQLIDRDTANVVECVFDPIRARELRATDRVSVYGELLTDSAGIPQRIDVDDFRVLPDRAKSLKELWELGLGLPDDEDSADFVHRTRGDLE